MRFLLDTNIIIHSAKGSLSKQALNVLDDTSHLLYFSPVSIWELVTKQQIGKLRLPADVYEIRNGLEQKGCRELLVNSRHALAIGALASVNKDPFDRMLVAQSFVEGLTLITTDSLLANYATDVMVVE
jgi:PIN domain nuclease of toxin-antitoxin system